MSEATYEMFWGFFTAWMSARFLSFILAAIVAAIVYTTDISLSRFISGPLCPANSINLNLPGSKWKAYGVHGVHDPELPADTR